MKVSKITFEFNFDKFNNETTKRRVLQEQLNKISFKILNGKRHEVIYDCHGNIEGHWKLEEYNKENTGV